MGLIAICELAERFFNIRLASYARKTRDLTRSIERSNQCHKYLTKSRALTNLLIPNGLDLFRTRILGLARPIWFRVESFVKLSSSALFFLAADLTRESKTFSFPTGFNSILSPSISRISRGRLIRPFESTFALAIRSLSHHQLVGHAY